MSPENLFLANDSYAAGRRQGALTRSPANVAIQMFNGSVAPRHGVPVRPRLIWLSRPDGASSMRRPWGGNVDVRRSPIAPGVIRDGL